MPQLLRRLRLQGREWGDPDAPEQQVARVSPRLAPRVALILTAALLTGCGRQDNPPAGNGIWSQQDVWEIWSEEFEGQYEEGGFYNLMFHPQVMGRPSRMRMLERLIRQADQQHEWLTEARREIAAEVWGGRAESASEAAGR